MAEGAARVVQVEEDAVRVMLPGFVLVMSLTVAMEVPAQPPPASSPQAGAPRATVPQPTPAAQFRRRGVQVMTLSSPAWAEGGRIPAKHTQAGTEVSPALAWDNVPEGVESFVLIVHDPHAAIGDGTDDLLHWMVWNIPGTARGLPEGVPHGDQLADGSRQISATGPYYRGPGAPTAGAAHHYVFELYALDIKLDVPSVGQSPPATRAAVMAAMAGHVRGKGAYVGLFKR
jgi:Raf kinase inhibitor-like YbhB/YbcL family protein